MDKQSALAIVGIFGDTVLVAQVLIIFVLAVFVLHKIFTKNKELKGIMKFISDNALPLAFLVALTAMSGSLFFSEIAKFVPCKLCWYQRICMYPQVLLLGIAAFKNDFGIKKYILPLSIIGAAVATYHYLLQMSPLPLPCSDELVSCAAKPFAYFGYITIPLMSLTAFIAIIILMLAIRKSKG